MSVPLRYLKYGKNYRVKYKISRTETKEVRGRYLGYHDKEVNSFKGSLGERRFYEFGLGNYQNIEIELDNIVECKEIVTIQIAKREN